MAEPTGQRFFTASDFRDIAAFLADLTDEERSETTDVVIAIYRVGAELLAELEDD